MNWKLKIAKCWNWNKFDFLLAILLGLIALVIYSTTSASHLTGLADSDEIIAVSALGGFVHPPGYPVLSTIIELWSSVLIASSIWQQINLLAGLLMAGVVSILYISGVKLIEIVANPKSLYFKRFSALVATLGLATSFTFWLYGGVMEVVQLNLLLLILIVYVDFILIQKVNEKNKIDKTWVFWWFLIGMGLMHQQAIAWLYLGLIPLTVKVMRSSGKKRLGGLAFVGIMLSGSLSIGLLWLRNESAEWSWQFNRSVNGLFNFLTRQDFSGINIETGKQHAYIKTSNLSTVINNFTDFLVNSAWNNFSFWYLIVVVLGLLVAVKYIKNLAIQSLLLFLVGSLLLVSYLNIGDKIIGFEYYQLRVLNERFYLMTYLILSLITVLGFYLIFLWIDKKSSKWVSKNFARTCVILLLGILLSFQVWKNVDGVNWKNFSILNEWVEQVSKSTNNNLIVCFSDISCFSMLAAKYVNGENLRVLPVTPQIKQSEEETGRFNYQYNPERIEDVVFWEIQNEHQVYLAELNSFYVNKLGMESKLLHLSPEGLIQEVRCDLPVKQLVNQTGLSYALSELNSDQRHSQAMLLKELWANNHEVNATVYGRMGKKALAWEEIKAGLTLSSKHLGLIRLARQLQNFPGNPAYSEENVCRDSEYWIHLASECKDFNEVDCELNYLHWATLVEPENVEARVKYAKILVDQEKFFQGYREYKNVLILDETNAEAIWQISKLEELLQRGSSVENL